MKTLNYIVVLFGLAAAVPLGIISGVSDLGSGVGDVTSGTLDATGRVVDGAGNVIETIGNTFAVKRGMVDGTLDTDKELSDAVVGVFIGLSDGAEQITDNVGDVAQGVRDDLKALGANVEGLLPAKRGVVTGLLGNVAVQLVDVADNVVDDLGSFLGNNAAAKRGLTLPFVVNLKDVLEKAGDTADNACSSVEGSS
ncbi:hypothetical protein LTR64_004145 [Lithohypha guttulata]|uniref:uncharacterized protein n=1 Tax=Lithohypha guttulata TaxID=1690604 RepID=UPI002DE1A85D|nr:hypothetical protein LTR51_006562 [Lithohypha guttulata]